MKKSLLQRISSIRFLEKAWLDIKHDPDSKGLDGISIADFEKSLAKNLKDIRSRLLSDPGYEFEKLRGQALPKDDGGYRPIKVAIVRDRVVQKAIDIQIRPFLEKKYKLKNHVSYGYIEGKSVQQAIEEVHRLYIEKGYKWIYQGDIKKFFDTVDVDNLLNNFIFPNVPDQSLNRLIHNALTVEIGNWAELEQAGHSLIFPESGIPQGCVLSPLFANVYLSPLDQAMLRHDYKMIRYADDFVVMCKTEDEGLKIHNLAKSIIENLHLTLHPLPAEDTTSKKHSTIEKFRNQVFLGIRFNFSNKYPAPKSIQKLKRKISFVGQLNVSKIAGYGLSKILTNLSLTIRSWVSIYSYTNFENNLYADLDNLLKSNLQKLMKTAGFAPSSGKIGETELRTLGIESFSHAFKKIHDQKKQKKNVQHLTARNRRGFWRPA